jgi:hypothetical protein
MSARCLPIVSLLPANVNLLSANVSLLPAHVSLLPAIAHVSLLPAHNAHTQHCYREVHHRLGTPDIPGCVVV